MVPAAGLAAWLRNRWSQGVVPVVGLEDPGRAGMTDTAVRDSLGRPGQGLRCRLLHLEPVVGLEDPGRAGMTDTAVRDSLGRPGQGLRCRLLHLEPVGPGVIGREPIVYENVSVSLQLPRPGDIDKSKGVQRAHRGFVALAHAPRCR